MEATGIIVAVVGLLITVIVIAGVFFTLYKVFGGLKRQNQERDRLLREGIQASARVLGVQMGGMTMTVGVHRHLQLQINLEVHPPGRPAYPAMLTTMVSELQVPQIQPGGMLTVRFDANDPSKLALEGVGAAQAATHGAAHAQGQPAHGAHAAYQQPGTAGQPGHAGQAYAGQAYAGQAYAGQAYAGQAYGAPGAGVVPVQGVPAMPKGAKIGLIIGLLGAVVGIGVAIVVVAMQVMGASGVALASGGAADSETSGSAKVCTQAARCCETIGAPPSACQNFEKVGMPDSACQTALDGYMKTASAQGKSCN